MLEGVDLKDPSRPLWGGGGESLKIVCICVSDLRVSSMLRGPRSHGGSGTTQSEESLGFLRLAQSC